MGDAGPQRQADVGRLIPDELEAGRDLDATTDASVDRTPGRVMLMRSLRCLPLLRWAPVQRVVDPNPLDHQHAILDLDIPFGL